MQITSPARIATYGLLTALLRTTRLRLVRPPDHQAAEHRPHAFAPVEAHVLDGVARLHPHKYSGRGGERLANRVAFRICHLDRVEGDDRVSGRRHVHPLRTQWP